MPAVRFLLACSLAACLLATLVRSTLATKEGYKSKTSSTSSVTLTLTLAPTRTEYWDRGGGARNIVQESSMKNEVRSGKWMRVAQKGLKMSCIPPSGHHNWTTIVFGKPWFWPVFEAFLAPNGPFLKAPFGLDRGQNCSTWGQNWLIPLLCAPPIVQNYPICSPLQAIFALPKSQNVLKMGGFATKHRSKMGQKCVSSKNDPRPIGCTVQSVRDGIPSSQLCTP